MKSKNKSSLVERGYRAARLEELMVSTKQVPIAVVGAGPYGLSIAAHLRARSVEHRIFGSPLQTWRSAMPRGMRLKSDAFASNLSAPSPHSTLGHYCQTHELPYHPTDIPVPLETFIDYGLNFQGRFVPHLEPKLIVSVRPAGSGYQLTLDDGDEFQARAVVVAVGITHFASMPDIFADLPPNLASHSSAHRDLSSFAGRDVTVVGAGSSAVDLAISLIRRRTSAACLSCPEREVRIGAWREAPKPGATLAPSTDWPRARHPIAAVLRIPRILPIPTSKRPGEDRATPSRSIIPVVPARAIRVRRRDPDEPNDPPGGADQQPCLLEDHTTRPTAPSISTPITSSVRPATALTSPG